MSFDWKTMPLLERLTNMASGNYYEDDIREAIAEIDRLQAVVDAARAFAIVPPTSRASDAELELRAALRALDGEPCRNCEGRAWMPSGERCFVCEGTGLQPPMQRALDGEP